MYRTGCVSGETGPTLFAEGPTLSTTLHRQFLIQYGCQKGSTVIMTPNDFMATEAWEETSPNIWEGLRDINPFVKANPQWFMIEIFDSFSAHMSSVLALKMALTYKILSLKEEGNTSHVNQDYDNSVAKSDKESCSYSVGIQREWKYYNCGVVCLRRIDVLDQEKLSSLNIKYFLLDDK